MAENQATANLPEPRPIFLKLQNLNSEVEFGFLFLEDLCWLKRDFFRVAKFIRSSRNFLRETPAAKSRSESESHIAAIVDSRPGTGMADQFGVEPVCQAVSLTDLQPEMCPEQQPVGRNWSRRYVPTGSQWAGTTAGKIADNQPKRLDLDPKKRVQTGSRNGWT